MGLVLHDPQTNQVAPPAPSLCATGLQDLCICGVKTLLRFGPPKPQSQIAKALSTTFLSPDNGGDIHSGADNSPLRDEKSTYFYGGIQAAAFVASPLLSSSGVEYQGLLHVSDWMPTLVSLAGGDTTDLELDGFDIWSAIRSAQALRKFSNCLTVKVRPW